MLNELSFHKTLWTTWNSLRKILAVFTVLCFPVIFILFKTGKFILVGQFWPIGHTFDSPDIQSQMSYIEKEKVGSEYAKEKVQVMSQCPPAEFD